MNIQLPHFVIAGLYKDALVVVEETPAQTNKIKQQVNNKTTKPETPATPPIKKWFLGDNKKNVTILVKDEAAVFINDEWLATLGKLLAACKLNLGDVAIINYHQHAVNFNELKEQLQPQRVLMFDVTTQDIQLSFTIPHYQVQQYGSCTFMTAPGITLSAEANTEMIKAEKTKLWARLRIIFSV